MEHNPVGWFEIYVRDMNRAKAFYERVFELELAPLPNPMPDIEMLFFPMLENATGCPGALAKMDGFEPGGGGVIIYFVCEDCSVEAARVEAAGGKVIKPKFSIGEYGFISMFIDTEGNVIGLHSQQ